MISLRALELLKKLRTSHDLSTACKACVLQPKLSLQLFGKS